MALKPKDIPNFVRLHSYLGLDQIAIGTRPVWWAFEAPLPLVLSALCETATGDFWDVGANTGLYSVLAARHLGGDRVHAFEPVPTIAGLCRDNLKLNSVAVTVHEVALSDRIGAATIYLPDAGHGLIETSASLSPDFKSSAQPSFSVPTTTIDQLRPDFGAMSVLKVDVEGFEAQVLRGAEETIRSDQPIIAVELMNGFDADYFHAFLARHNYDLIALPSNRPAFVTSELRFRLDGWNQLLVPHQHTDSVLEQVRDLYAAEVSAPEDGEAQEVMRQLNLEIAAGGAELEQALDTIRQLQHGARSWHQRARSRLRRHLNRV